MKFVKCTIVLSFVFACLSILHSSCAKEYSFEGSKADTLGMIDSVPITVTKKLKGCDRCVGNSVRESEWSFTIGGERYCGSITRGVLNVERNAFTFFGPSSCSKDSGMIISAYLDTTLSNDSENVVTNRGAFYYYDNVLGTHVLISRANSGFSVTIDRFVAASGLTTGRFAGVTFTEKGDVVSVASGRFAVYLE